MKAVEVTRREQIDGVWHYYPAYFLDGKPATETEYYEALKTIRDKEKGENEQ